MSGGNVAPQTLSYAQGWPGMLVPPRTHACRVATLHKPRRMPLKAMGGPTSVVGQDFILRPIFNRPTRRRLPQRFVAPETFPPGIGSRSWRRLRFCAFPRQRRECRCGTHERATRRFPSSFDILRMGTKTATARTLRVTEDELMDDLNDDRRSWLIGGGAGIHWPDLDGDISVLSLLAGRRSAESQYSPAMGCSSVSRRLD